MKRETIEEYLKRGGKIHKLPMEGRIPMPQIGRKRRNWDLKSYDYSNVDYPPRMYERR